MIENKEKQRFIGLQSHFTTVQFKETDVVTKWLCRCFQFGGWTTKAPDTTQQTDAPTSEAENSDPLSFKLQWHSERTGGIFSSRGICNEHSSLAGISFNIPAYMTVFLQGCHAPSLQIHPTLPRKCLSGCRASIAQSHKAGFKHSADSLTQEMQHMLLRLCFTWSHKHFACN